MDDRTAASWRFPRGGYGWVTKEPAGCERDRCGRRDGRDRRDGVTDAIGATGAAGENANGKEA